MMQAAEKIDHIDHSKYLALMFFLFMNYKTGIMNSRILHLQLALNSCPVILWTLVYSQLLYQLLLSRSNVKSSKIISK